MQGDFGRESVFDGDPAAHAAAFAAAGARWVHVVDLDAARSGGGTLGPAVRGILEAFPAPGRVELGGGIRTRETALGAIAAGAARIVVGTAAVADPGFVGALVTELGSDRVAVAIDVRDGRAVGEAWRDGAAGRPAAEVLAALADAGVIWFEATAIERDGRMAGPDLGLLKSLVAVGRGRIVASAGIRSVDDLARVRDLGCAGAIVGRALYEGRLQLADALGLEDRR